MHCRHPPRGWSRTRRQRHPAPPTLTVVPLPARWSSRREWWGRGSRSRRQSCLGEAGAPPLVRFRSRIEAAASARTDRGNLVMTAAEVRLWLVLAIDGWALPQVPALSIFARGSLCRIVRMNGAVSWTWWRMIILTASLNGWVAEELGRFYPYWNGFTPTPQGQGREKLLQHIIT